jgi:hypothetical protein
MAENVFGKPVPEKNSQHVDLSGVMPCSNSMCSRPPRLISPDTTYLCSSGVPPIWLTCTIVTELDDKLKAPTVQFPVTQSPCTSVGDEKLNALERVLLSLAIVTTTDLGLM